MVASDKCDPVGIANFKAEEKEEGLEGVEAAVDEISHEEVVGFGDVATHSEKLHEVMKLAMDVAAYLRRRREVSGMMLMDIQVGHGLLQVRLRRPRCPLL